MCWRQNALKAVERVDFSLSFFPSTSNDVRRKLYMVGIQSTVEKPATRMPDTTVETTQKPKSCKRKKFDNLTNIEPESPRPKRNVLPKGYERLG